MKRESHLSLTSVALFALGVSALTVATPQSAIAAGESSSEIIVIAQASPSEAQDTDVGKAEKDTGSPVQTKQPPKPKQTGRKGGPDPKVRAAKRDRKIKLILEDQLRTSAAIAATQKETAGEKNEAKKAMADDNDMSDAKRDSEYVKEAKREAKPKEAGRGDRHDPKLRAEKRAAKLKLLAKDRQ